MKFLFPVIAVVLCLAGVGTYLSFPDTASPIPVLYWTTGPNPTRVRTVEVFHEWLITRGHGQRHELTTMEQLRAFRDRPWTDEQRRAIASANPEGAKVWAAGTTAADLPLSVTVPAFELRVDAGTHDMRKRVVQGVSGVASAIFSTSGPNIDYMQQIGMLADVTEAARELGFSLDATYPGLKPIMFVDGRQYAFPSNVTTLSYLVNAEVFEDVGMDPPPVRWTVEQFERIGKELIARANQGPRQTVFMADRAPPLFHRVFGVSMFNETMTRSTLDDPRVVASLAVEHKWTHVDHLLPTAAEISSFDVEGGMRGGLFQLVHDGHLGMFNTGRWALIELRRMGGDVPLRFAELPHAGFACSLLTGHTLGVYQGSPHRDLATLFLAFLASETYSLRVIEIADSLPPRPDVVDLEQFTRPAAHPSEWSQDHSVHEAFARDARENGVAWSVSPYVSFEICARSYHDMRSRVLSNVASPEEAAAAAAAHVNREIQRSLAESPELRQRYQRRLAIQRKIDEHRAADRPVPVEWIDNPYYRELYERRGWLGDAAQTPAVPPEAPTD